MIAHLVELHIKLCCLAQSHVDFLDFADLAADVIMDKFQAVLHIMFGEEVESFKEFRRGEAELAAVAARFFPLARAGACQLDAHTQIRRDFQAFRYLGGGLQLVEFLDDDDDLAAHLLGEQGQFDELLVLVAVAHDERVRIRAECQDGVEFGLGASLQADVAFLAVADDFLDHRAHLVHLDGHHDEVLSVELVFLGRLLEAGVNLVDAVVKNVGET